MNRKQKKIFIIVFMVSLLLFSLLALNIVNRFRPTGIVGPDIYLEKKGENTNRNNKTTFNDDVIKLREKNCINDIGSTAIRPKRTPIS